MSQGGICVVCCAVHSYLLSNVITSLLNTNILLNISYCGVCSIVRQYDGSSRLHFPLHVISFPNILIRSNEMQQYAGVYLLQNYSTCFGCLSHPSSGVHQTVTASSGTDHITCQSSNLPPAWPN